MPQTSRIALGTVQFGLPYGVANQQGLPSLESVQEIVECAWEAGIHTLDTAIGYGESESRLGKIGVTQWDVITKLGAVPDDKENVKQWVKDEVNHSRRRLGVSVLFGVLLHRASELLKPYGQDIYDSLCELQDEGVVKKIGVSVYSPDEIKTLIASYNFDVIQAPFNFLDRRLFTSGMLEQLASMDVEVHIRSIYLQGLLLMSDQKRPAYFNSWQPLFEQWNQWLNESKMTPAQACLRFVMSYPSISKILVGVDCADHLHDLVANVEAYEETSFSDIHCSDLELIDPSRWNIS